MKKLNYAGICAVLLLMSFMPPPDNGAAEFSYSAQIKSNFVKFQSLGVPEKIYLQTDKPYYSAGEKVWFKVFLVDAIHHTPGTDSKYVYVELINRYDSICSRQKIKADQYGFNGVLKLPVDIVPGEYSIRSYTTWMRNQGEDFFFSRNIHVVNPLDDIVNSSIDYTTNSDGTVTAKIKVANNKNEPIAEKKVSCLLDLNTDKTTKVTQRTNQNGELELIFKPNNNSKDSHIDISLSDVNTESPEVKRFFVPTFSNDFDVQFFPEGGALLNGVLQNVSFKAIGINGLSTDVKGRVENEQGEEIATVETMHKGMGRFAIVPKVGSKNYAVLVSGAGLEKRFELPAVSASGCIVQAKHVKGNIVYKVQATPDINVADLGIVVQSRGELITADKLTAENKPKVIPEDKLPEGITQIALVDKDGNVLSQRLVFVKNDNQRVAPVISTNKPNYREREYVKLDIQVLDDDGKPLTGNFAVSVTDNSTVDLSLYKDNIVSSLFLTTDIKGHVEDPAYYFSENTPVINEHLDLLMTTQGWTRFDLSGVVKGSVEQYKYSPEKWQSIAGYANGFFGGRAKNPTITAVCPVKKYFASAPLGKAKRFEIVDLDIPDGISYIVSAIGQNGGKMLTIKVEQDSFPEPSSHFYSANMPVPVKAEYAEQAKAKYYNDGGMRVIDLKAVTVNGQRVMKDQQMMIINSNSANSTSFTYGPSYISKYKDKDIYDLISGVSRGLHTIIRDGYTGEQMVYINGEKHLLMGIGALQVSQIASISVSNLRGLTSGGAFGTTFGSASESTIGSFGPGSTTRSNSSVDAFGNRVSSSTMGPPGIRSFVTINLKPGEIFTGKHDASSIAVVKPLGYTKAESFYVPKYTNAQARSNPNPDLRSTIYWDPKIKTNEQGVATVFFPAADKECDYDIVVEGVADNGKVCRNTKTIKRKQI